VVAIWPAADRLYDLLGVAVPSLGEGLVIRDVAVELATEGESTVPMVVKGVVINQSPQAISLPTMRATLRGKDRQPIEAWMITTDHPLLQPGESFAFQSHLPTLPPEATQLAITFVQTPQGGDATAPEHAGENVGEKGGASVDIQHGQNADKPIHNSAP